MATVDDYRSIIEASLGRQGQPEDVRSLIRRVAAREGVPEDIALRLAEVESGLNPNAVGPKTRHGRAMGLFQLMPALAAGRGVRDPFDPEENATAALSFLRENFERFGSWPLAVAAYHAGPNAVARAGGIPDTADVNMKTSDYVRRITGESASPMLGQSPEDEETKAVYRWISEYLSYKPKPEEYGFRPLEAAKRGLVGLGATGAFLLNKLERAATGDDRFTSSLLEKAAKAYAEMPSDPRLQEWADIGDKADGLLPAIYEMVVFAMKNPSMVGNFLAEQAVPLVAGLPFGGITGAIGARAALAAGASERLAQIAKTASFGAGLNSSQVVMQGLGANYAEGLSKGLDEIDASIYATNKTMAEVGPNAVAGALMAWTPTASRFVREARKAGIDPKKVHIPVLARVKDAAIQSQIQGAGGAAGAYMASVAVDEDPRRSEMILEWLGESALAPFEIGAEFVSRRAPEQRTASDARSPDEATKLPITTVVTKEELERAATPEVPLRPAAEYDSILDDVLARLHRDAERDLLVMKERAPRRRKTARAVTEPVVEEEAPDDLSHEEVMARLRQAGEEEDATQQTTAEDATAEAPTADDIAKLREAVDELRARRQQLQPTGLAAEVAKLRERARARAEAIVPRETSEPPAAETKPPAQAGEQLTLLAEEKPQAQEAEVTSRPEQTAPATERVTTAASSEERKPTAPERAEEKKAVEAGETKPEEQKTPEAKRYEPGDRVVIRGDDDEMAGRHGVVVDEFPNQIRDAYGNILRTVRTYTVRTDSGATTTVDSEDLDPEVGEPPRAVPDIKIGDKFMTPRQAREYIADLERQREELRFFMRGSAHVRQRNSYARAFGALTPIYESAVVAIRAWEKEHGQVVIEPRPEEPPKQKQQVSVTKTNMFGHPIWAARLNERVDADAFKQISDLARQLGGRWNKPRRAFVFGGEDNANSFADQVRQLIEEAKQSPNAQPRREEEAPPVNAPTKVGEAEQKAADAVAGEQATPEKAPAEPQEAPTSPTAEAAGKTERPSADSGTSISASDEALDPIRAHEAARAAYFTPGNIIRNYPWYEEVLEYFPPKEPGGEWSVLTHVVVKRDGQWVRVGNPDDARQYSPEPSARQLAEGPVARLDYTPGKDVLYTEPVPYGRTYKHAPDRGVKKPKQQQEEATKEERPQNTPPSKPASGTPEPPRTGSSKPPASGPTEPPAAGPSEPAEQKAGQEKAAAGEAEQKPAEEKKAAGRDDAEAWWKSLSDSDRKKMLDAVAATLPPGVLWKYIPDDTKAALLEARGEVDLTTGGKDEGAVTAGSTEADGRESADGESAEAVRPPEGERRTGGRTGRARVSHGRSVGHSGRRDIRPRVEDQSASDGNDQLAQPSTERGGGDRDSAGDRVSDRGRGESGVGVDHRIGPEGVTRRGSWKETAKRNLDIIELSKRIEAEGRPATPEEQALLAQYTGWGASEMRQNIFPTPYPYQSKENPDQLFWPENARDDGWRELSQRALELLTKEEQREALSSSQYAHYTSGKIVRAIYAALQRMGFTGGRVLEPGMGTGLFAMLMPDAMYKASRYTGIERDILTGRIAKLLLPRQNVIVGDFVKQRVPRDYFDLAIGNPPFQSIRVYDDPAYKKHRFFLHDYFFAKSVDSVRPGGLLVFITSTGTMDKKDDAARAYLAERADLLGAIRLPQAAFKENAGTEVVTDVLFLRKRAPGEQPAGEQWLGLKEVKAGDGTALVNEYFARHPEMVLGRHSLTGSMYRKNSYTVVPIEGDIEAQFAEAAARLPENVYKERTETKTTKPEVAVERDFNPKATKEGGLYRADDGSLKVVMDGVGVPVEQAIGRPLRGKEAEFLSDYIDLRDAVKDAQIAQWNDDKWEDALKNLQRKYKEFVSKHGRIRSFTTVIKKERDDDGNTIEVPYKRYKYIGLLRKADVESALVWALESIRDDVEIVEGDMLRGRTLAKPKPVEIKSVADALAVSLDQIGYLDVADVAKRAGVDVQSAVEQLGDLVYELPSGGWQLADEYLSGDVVAKLEEAEVAAGADNRFRRNVEALRKVQPKPLGPDQITVRLGASWIPPKYIEDFAREVLGEETTVRYTPETNAWNVEGANLRTRHVVSEWGMSGRPPLAILEAILNNKSLVARKKIDETKTTVDQESTAKINDIAAKMRETFASWVWTNAARASDLIDIYNRKFNNLAPRRFDGSHLSMPGVSMTLQLMPHQKRAIWRAIQTGNMYAAHAVGAGKTFMSIGAAMEQKRLGLIRKPLFIVPNHMLDQFAAEFKQMYPAANIMVADEDNFTGDNRRRFVAQAAVNAPDAIIMTHSMFSRVPLSEKVYKEYVEELIKSINAAIEDAAIKDRFTRRQLEQKKEALWRYVEGLINTKDADKAVTFEQLGVDYLIVDEAHLFRKLMFATNRTGKELKGISPEGSSRALDLYIKVKWLAKQRPGRSHMFLSGTPVTNTMGELFTLQRFFDEEGLKADGIDHFDAWANTFGEMKPGFERNAAGDYEVVTRFSTFVNVPELMKRVRQFMDVLTSDQLGEIVKRPDLEGGRVQNIIVKQSERLKDYMQGVLRERIEQSRKWRPSADQPGNPDPLINIITDARLATIDERFFDPKSENNPNSKLNKMIDEIIADYRKYKDEEYTTDGKPDPIKGATQIVFSPIGFGSESRQKRGFDARAWISKRLQMAGIKASEVVWAEDLDSDAKKAKAYEDMRAGRVKILIGSPAKMGTGLNVQKRLKVLHYLTPPWYPADVEQPHGRILRQGNQNKEVVIKWYATEGTYDSTQWDMVARKARFIAQAMSGDESIRKLEDISEVSQYEMASALASGDKRVMQLAGLSADIERLQRLKAAHYAEQKTLKEALRDATIRVAYLERRLKSINHVLATHKMMFGEDFKATVGDKTFTERIEFGDALIEAYNKALKEAEESSRSDVVIKLGEIGGLPIVLVTSGRRSEDRVKNAKLAIELMPAKPTESGDYEDIYDKGGPIGNDVGGYSLGLSVQNKYNNLTRKSHKLIEQLEDARAEKAKYERAVDTPFPEERTLAEKIAERAQLQAELAAESKDTAEEPPVGDPLNDPPLEETFESRAAGRPQQATQASAIERAASEFVKRLPGASAVKVRVVDTRQDIPEQDREKISDIAEGAITFADDGSATVYLIASNLSSEARAQQVLLHEIVGHYGLRALLGERFGEVLASVKERTRARSEKVRAAASGPGRQNIDIPPTDPDYASWDAVRALYPDADEAAVAEEVLARMAETGARPLLLERVTVMLRRALRAIGFKLDYSKAELKQLVLDAAKALRDGRQPVAVTPETRESRLPERIASGALADAWPTVAQKVHDAVFDALLSKRTFGLWARTVGTQMAKARDNPEFRRVFNRAQKFIDDISRYALRAEGLAPTILPKVGGLKDVPNAIMTAIGKGGLSAEDNEWLGRVLAEGTLAGLEPESYEKEPTASPLAGRVWTDEELRKRFNADDRKIALYKEARAAIDQSLEDAGRATMLSAMRAAGFKQSHIAALEGAGTLAELRADAEQLIDEAVGQAPNDESVIAWAERTKARLKDIHERITELQKAGYAPLMRFGRYYLTAYDGDDVAYFARFDSVAELLRERRRLERERPDLRLDSGEMSLEAHKLFKGVDPETLVVLAAHAGLEDEVLQKWYELAVAERSALKRMIHRKGTPGFSLDARRALASFIMSNARYASRVINVPAMNDAARSISDGLVKDEAIRLIEYVQSPTEEASRVRGLLFAWYLGGSIAAGVVNLTQPLLMTLPYLSRFGVKEAASAMRRGLTAAQRFMRGANVDDEELMKALARAQQDGITQPSEVHALMAASRGAFQSPLMQAFHTVWGANFALTEAFNRTLTFAAAFIAAKEAGSQNPYAFAKRAVYDTQGLYTRANRPNWARGPIGATVFTFKQFSIAYVEFLKQLADSPEGKKQLAVALGLLILASGLQGLPGADDLDDLIDAVGQWLGYATNIRQSKRQLLEGVLGETLGNVAMYGISTQMGVDLSARLGLGNIIPGTGALIPSKPDKTRDIVEFAGPLGSLLMNTSSALERIFRGDVSGALQMATPVAVRNILKGTEMLVTGEARDEAGRRIMDASPGEAVAKIIGFTPQRIAEQGRRIREIKYDENIVNAKASEIRETWARGVAHGDMEMVRDAREMLIRWNEQNPSMPIRIRPRDVMRRAQDIRRSRQERFIRSVPQALRERAREELEEVEEEE